MWRCLAWTIERQQDVVRLLDILVRWSPNMVNVEALRPFKYAGIIRLLGAPVGIVGPSMPAHLERDACLFGLLDGPGEFTPGVEVRPNFVRPDNRKRTASKEVCRLAG